MLFGGVKVFIQLVGHGKPVVALAGLFIQLDSLLREFDGVGGRISLQVAEGQVQVEHQHNINPLLFLVLVEAIPDISGHVFELSEAS